MDFGDPWLVVEGIAKFELRPNGLFGGGFRFQGVWTI